MATSTIQLTDELKSILRETSQKLKGSERRQFMAKNEMNYRLRRVVKAKPQKRADRRKGTRTKTKIPETDAIFDQVNQINQQADQDDNTLPNI